MKATLQQKFIKAFVFPLCAGIILSIAITILGLYALRSKPQLLPSSNGSNFRGRSRKIRANPPKRKQHHVPKISNPP